MGGISIDLAFALFHDEFSSAPEVPVKTGLLYNTPNPFNPMTVIHYMMPEGGGDVRLEVFDAKGRRVATLVDGYVEGGRRSATWTGRSDAGAEMPSGTYLYRLKSEDFEETKKMTLIK